MKSEFICKDGAFIKKQECSISLNNRVFRYGDGFFESIFARNTIPVHLENHFSRIQKSMELLKMKAPETFSVDHLKQIITKLLNKNLYYKGARVRLSIFREDGGLYTPASNKISYIITSQPLDHASFTVNQKGLIVDYYTDMRKQVNYISNIKHSNSLIFVLAGIYKNEKKLDECIIMNDKGFVCESISSNIFLIKDGKIYTPPLSDGCIAGVMRKQIILLARNMGYYVSDHKSIHPNDLLLADELFLTNAIAGIRWIVALKNKRYFNKISKAIMGKLNEQIISS
jgi:branched-chain amino acid aminotransferase